MARSKVNPARIRGAWEGRVSGCMLGKAVEVLSFTEGQQGLESYLRKADAWPLRDYVPLLEGTVVSRTAPNCCRNLIVRAEPDDDISYTFLALLLLEEHGADFDVVDVARTWLKLLPAGVTWTAEREAYKILLNNMANEFVNGDEPGFDLDRCSDNNFNEWIGAQIRADLYGWVCPGRPELAARLARHDASLSHRGDGVHGAVFIASLGAAVPAAGSLDVAIDQALEQIPPDSGVASAVRLGRSLRGDPEAIQRLQQAFVGMSPVHTLNNLAVVVWALCSAEGDFGAAIGGAVSAGWDTDCNGATVGGLLGLSGASIADTWTAPWAGRISLGLAGYSEVHIDDVTRRTVEVARCI